MGTGVGGAFKAAVFCSSCLRALAIVAMRLSTDMLARSSVTAGAAACATDGATGGAGGGGLATKPGGPELGGGVNTGM